MTSLRLEAVAGRDVEAALARIASATLVRRPDGVFARVDPVDASTFVRGLAFAGIAATECELALVPPADAHAAIGRDLAPLRDVDVAFDAVEVRRLDLGVATREALARRFGLPRRTRAQRDRCRALLRGEDAAFAWRRRVWAGRAALRAAGSRIRLRRIVFDAEALTRPRDEGRALASERRIGAWLF